MEPMEKLPNRNRRERGMAVLISAVLMFFTIGTVGLAVDGGLAYLVKGRLMAAVDAASLGAARGLNLGEDVNAANAAATTAAARFFNANFPQGYMATDPNETSVTPTFTVVQSNGSPTGILQVDVTGSVMAPTYFMNLFNVAKMRVSATGTATRRTLVMMMVLDVSGSMQQRQTLGTIPATVTSSTRSCDAMIFAASKFLDYFSSYDYIGAATFGSDTRVVYAPSTSYKRSDGAGLNAILRNINCPGWTNTAPSINLAWDQIRNVGLKLAMNEVILFTDGMPNVVTGNFPLRTQRDTRFGPAQNYSGTNPSPPTTSTAQLLYKDSLDPFAPSTYNLATNVTPTLDGPYTSAQQVQRNAGVLARYGDSRFLPLTTDQWNKYNGLTNATKAAFGWFLPGAGGPYRARWIVDVNAPAMNYFNCTNANRSVNVADRGVTWMCYDMPLAATGMSPATFYGSITAGRNPNNSPSYNPIHGDRANFFGVPVFGETVTHPPSGFPRPSSNGATGTAQSVAFFPLVDSKGNSNYGFRENWVYNVNQGCAPSGTPLPNGATSLCKFRGGLWADYPAAGLGTNKFTAGPYVDRMRPDLPNAFPAAAMNSAVDAANRVKADTEYNIRFDTVYLVGTEDNVDREFLQIIANVQVFKPTIFDGAGAPNQGANPHYNPNHQEGLWYYTTNPADLAGLFAQIAGSLLRLSA